MRLDRGTRAPISCSVHSDPGAFSLDRCSTAALAARLTARYAAPDRRRSLWQLASSFAPYVLIWVLMIESLAYSYWLTLALSIPAAGFLIRIFIVQHDCGHGSLFRSRRVNDRVGGFCGLFTLTPYRHWRRQHNVHHAHAGKLERRGLHYVPTLTVKEYLDASAWMRLRYRLFRHPSVLFGVVPPLYFLVLNRFNYGTPAEWSVERRSVYRTNLALAGGYAALGAVIGARELAAIGIPVLFTASIAGFWLFYVQHEFENTYFAREAEWDYFAAALRGSSYYKLPRLLQWFTGNIGLHHVHHLAPRIPNYNLQRCHDENRLLQQVAPLGVRRSLSAASLRLWDEKRRKLVGFRDLEAAGAARASRS